MKLLISDDSVTAYPQMSEDSQTSLSKKDQTIVRPS